MYSEYKASEDVGGDRDCHEEGFEWEGLVIGSREKEVCLRGWDRACYERYYACICDVEGGKDSEDVG